MEVFKIENWQNIWGLVIIIGLPLLFVLATSVYNRRKSSKDGLIPPQIIRWLLVPFLSFHLILTKINGNSHDETGIKISTTIIVIILLSFLFNAINYLFFSEKNVLTKEEIIPKLGRDVLHMFLMTIVSACVLSKVWGVDLGNLLTALGVGSLVIGLALQEPLGNLFNGVSLLMANPFKKGDWVHVAGEIGKVTELNWRSVKIHTRFNEEIIIPNNMLGKEKIKNFSRPNKIHAELLQFGFSYDDNPVEVKALLLELAEKNDKVLSNPKPVALTLSYDDFSITYGLKCFIKDFEDNIALNDELMTSLFLASKEKGFRIPFPTQEIEVKMNKGQ
jgi:small-conductance mechanosensitive channel